MHFNAIYAAVVLLLWTSMSLAHDYTCSPADPKTKETFVKDVKMQVEDQEFKISFSDKQNRPYIYSIKGEIQTLSGVNKEFSQLLPSDQFRLVGEGYSGTDTNGRNQSIFSQLHVTQVEHAQNQVKMAVTIHGIQLTTSDRISLKEALAKGHWKIMSTGKLEMSCTQ